MTGSIEKREKNSYRLVVFKGYDLDGKPIRHQKTIHCKKKQQWKENKKTTISKDNIRTSSFAIGNAS